MTVRDNSGNDQELKTTSSPLFAALSLITPLGKINGGTSSAANKVVVNKVSASISSVVTCSTGIPIDNTIPQNTEGNQVLTCSITPLNSANILEVAAVVTGANASSQFTFAMALFKDAEAGARSAIYETLSSQFGHTFQLMYSMTAGGTSSITFQIRLGGNGATFYVNGDNAGGRLMGGVAGTYLTITEYA